MTKTKKDNLETLARQLDELSTYLYNNLDMNKPIRYSREDIRVMKIRVGQLRTKMGVKK